MQADAAGLDAALPDYQVRERLGQGQFGVVWAARHRQLDREVAVKQLTGTAIADPRNAERFRREARLLAQLDHRHVVRVYDYRETDGLSLLIMERLVGGTFADRQAAGLGFESIIVAVIAAASGLHHLHLKGVLHRDIKPANLMFDGSNILKVTDFGTARGQSVLQGLTQTVDLDAAGSLVTPDDDAQLVDLSVAGEFMGTPGFAAPEQAAAALGLAAAAVGPAADQYALAAVLYQSLTSFYTHSIDGGTVALLTRRATTPARPVEIANPAVPAALSAVLMRSLERRPEDRFSSVEEFALALAGAAASQWGPNWAERSTVGIAEPGRLWDAVHPAAVPARKTAPAHHRRRPVVLVVTAAVIVAVITAVVLVVRSGAIGGSPADTAGAADTAASAASTATVMQVQVDADWRFATDGKVFATPTVAGNLVVVGSRDGTVYGIDRESGQERWRQPTGGPVRSSAAVSGDLAIVGSDDGFLRALDTSDGQERWRAPLGYQIVSSPVVAQGLVFVGADRLYALDAQTGQQRWVADTGGVIASSPAVAGDVVMIGGKDGFLHTFSTVNGLQVWTIDTGGLVVAAPVVADGVAYVGSRSGTVVAITAATGVPVWTHDVGGTVNGSVAVNGDQVLIGTGQGSVFAVRRADAAEQWTWTGNSRVDASLAVAGDAVVVGTGSGVVQLLDAENGFPTGEFATGGPVLSSPRVADGEVFVGSDDNSVYRLRIVPD